MIYVYKFRRLGQWNDVNCPSVQIHHFNFRSPITIRKNAITTSHEQRFLTCDNAPNNAKTYFFLCGSKNISVCICTSIHLVHSTSNFIKKNYDYKNVKQYSNQFDILFLFIYLFYFNAYDFLI